MLGSITQEGIPQGDPGRLIRTPWWLRLSRHAHSADGLGASLKSVFWDCRNIVPGETPFEVPARALQPATQGNDWNRPAPRGS